MNSFRISWYVINPELLTDTTVVAANEATAKAKLLEMLPRAIIEKVKKI